LRRRTTRPAPCKRRGLFYVARLHATAHVATHHSLARPTQHGARQHTLVQRCPCLARAAPPQHRSPPWHGACITR